MNTLIALIHQQIARQRHDNRLSTAIAIGRRYYPHHSQYAPLVYHRAPFSWESDWWALDTLTTAYAGIYGRRAIHLDLSPVTVQTAVAAHIGLSHDPFRQLCQQIQQWESVGWNRRAIAHCLRQQGG
jgi:hypothetical protein